MEILICVQVSSKQSTLIWVDESSNLKPKTLDSYLG
jgi:hypothetical protein